MGIDNMFTQSIGEEYVFSIEKLIKEVICSITGNSSLPSHEEIKNRGLMEILPNGDKLFLWDDIARVRISPPLATSHRNGVGSIFINLSSEVHKMD